MRHIRCPLCGYHFDPSALACHSHCPMSQRCGLICCPNCGYQIPDEEKSSLAAWLRRLLARPSSPPAASSPGAPEDTRHYLLSELPTGTTVQVVAIRSARAVRLERLSLLGIIPGSRIRLEQRWPAVIVQVGETELSLDEDVAQQIVVTTSPRA